MKRCGWNLAKRFTCKIGPEMHPDQNHRCTEQYWVVKILRIQRILELYITAISTSAEIFKGIKMGCGMSKWPQTSKTRCNHIQLSLPMLFEVLRIELLSSLDKRKQIRVNPERETIYGGSGRLCAHAPDRATKLSKPFGLQGLRKPMYYSIVVGGNTRSSH